MNAGSITRATGIVGGVLMVGAVMWGLFFSGRSMGPRRAPNWWLDLHNWLGGLSLAFVGIHVIAGVVDGTSLGDSFVPGAAGDGGMTFGILSMYALILVVVTSWPRRRLPRRVWHALHLLSLPALPLAALHGRLFGTDGTTVWFSVLLAVCLGAVLYPGLLRLRPQPWQKRSSTPPGV